MAGSGSVQDADGADAEGRDFLSELLDDYAACAPTFQQLYESAVRERALLRSLAEKRKAAGISQRELARRMATSQPAIARLERGEVDPKLSTLARFAAAIGQQVDWRIRPVRRRPAAGPPQ